MKIKEKKHNVANICFDCKNAVPDDQGHGCPWSRKFEPVPGWTAEPVMMGGNSNSVNTYSITACPLFDPDGGPEYYRADKRKPVRCIETGVEFESITAAARAVGGSTSPICEAINERNGYAYGYHWERIEKEREV